MNLFVLACSFFLIYAEALLAKSSLSESAADELSHELSQVRLNRGVAQCTALTTEEVEEIKRRQACATKPCAPNHEEDVKKWENWLSLSERECEMSVPKEPNAGIIRKAPAPNLFSTTFTNGVSPTEETHSRAPEEPLLEDYLSLDGKIRKDKYGKFCYGKELSEEEARTMEGILKMRDEMNEDAKKSSSYEEQAKKFRPFFEKIRA